MHIRPGLVFLSLFLLSALAMNGCATRAGESAYSPGGNVTLPPGGTLELPDGARLRYVGVVADSRCPPGAQCVRAGEAQVRIELGRGSAAPESLVLDTAGRPAGVLAGWRLELVELAFGPAPPATIRVLPADP